MILKIAYTVLIIGFPLCCIFGFLMACFENVISDIFAFLAFILLILLFISLLYIFGIGTVDLMKAIWEISE